jgi:hypothetical protein
MQNGIRRQARGKSSQVPELTSFSPYPAASFSQLRFSHLTHFLLSVLSDPSQGGLPSQPAL